MLSGMMSPGGFVVLAIAASWACWLPAAYGGEWFQAQRDWLLPLGWFAPLIALLIQLARPSCVDARRTLLSRYSEPRRLLSLAGALSVLVPGAVAALSIATYAWLGGIILPTLPAADFAPVFLAALLLNGLPEEIAWRGHALPLALARWDALTAAVLVGLAWNIWQLPLFALSGTVQWAIEIGSAEHFLYATQGMAESLVLCALYRMSGSAWTALAYRAVTCFAGELWQLPLGAELHRALWTIAAAVLVLARPAAFSMEGEAQRRSPQGSTPG
ncbi:MAG: CPBP family intramembrane metalloprotease [Gammaproteobacteria bacterium]|nr:CPBP family intramembrane metalloprotease [Gammaproteobacteria bacterium]